MNAVHNVVHNTDFNTAVALLQKILNSSLYIVYTYAVFYYINFLWHVDLMLNVLVYSTNLFHSPTINTFKRVCLYVKQI